MTIIVLSPGQSNDDRIRKDAGYQAAIDADKIKKWCDVGRLTLIDAQKAKEEIEGLEGYAHRFIREKLDGINSKDPDCKRLVDLYGNHYCNRFNTELGEYITDGKVRYVSDQREHRLYAMAIEDRKNRYDYDKEQVGIIAEARAFKALGIPVESVTDFMADIQEYVKKYQECQEKEVEKWPPSFRET